MRIIKTGDPCPLCGRPVTAEDRENVGPVDGHRADVGSL